MLSEALYYSRMALGLLQMARMPQVCNHEHLVRDQLRDRESSFLTTARRVVFDNPTNPYHQMFAEARCSYGDLEQNVRRHGLESSLAAIQRAGVYLTHDEFKGKQPIVRSGKHIESNEKAFVNPSGVGMFEGRSSGSRSRATRTSRSIRLLAYREAFFPLLRREFKLDEREWVSLNRILPSATGLSRGLAGSRVGVPVKRWFSTCSSLRGDGHYRAVTALLVLEAKLLGARMPFPTYLPADDFSPVARWIAGRRRDGVTCGLGGPVSPCVRVAMAAREKNLDIAGTLFFVGGEALTDTKRAAIESAGAEVYPGYATTEIGMIGHSCRAMNSGNCVHVLRDSIAVISRRRPAPLSGTEINSLLFTTLLPFAPHFLINVEMDDAGVIEPARCDCSFSKFGYDLQIRDIFSYGKLTGQGITLVGTDVVRLLEEKLPARFGGGPADYQLVESDRAGQTTVTLRVSPRVGVSSVEEISSFFLGCLGSVYGGSMTVREWTHSKGFTSVVAEPLSTTSGKVLSLHLLGRGGPPRNTVQQSEES